MVIHRLFKELSRYFPFVNKVLMIISIENASGRVIESPSVFDICFLDLGWLHVGTESLPAEIMPSVLVVLATSTISVDMHKYKGKVQ